MIATKDADRVDQTTLRCCVYNQFRSDEGYVDTGDQSYSAEFPLRSIGLARRWVEQTLIKHGWQQRDRDDVIWDGDMRVGTYRDASFHDDGWGHIRDASWEEHEQGPFYDALLQRDGTVTWADS